MADIIQFRGRFKSNGAREALIDLALTSPAADGNDAEWWADWLLAELWSRGFKVVPLDPIDEVPTG